ncbi:MAG: T9SS type A sorting domain-containing protein [Bacteroidetes bacterium]|nr:T9SS type A sorting domain-containing protein [Bacteroidota bacterium]
MFLLLSLGSEAQPSLSLELYENGFTLPVDIANAGDERLFVVEQSGIIKIIDGNGNTLATPFLDIEDRVLDFQSEQGLLGLAFPPNYGETGHFYVNYTWGSGSGRTHISRFSVDPSNPDLALANSEEILIDFYQPVWNHNGGDINFGPDGYMYISSGDGGGAGDVSNNAQNVDLFLGKILRIDVDTAASYRIPTDNPFFGLDGHKQQIWSYGLRNPWRFSFDRMTGDMWIGDVGQGLWEEVDFETADNVGGVNYGWRCYEGTHDFSLSGCSGSYTEPIFEYPHENDIGGLSVTGGYVYRGAVYPEMNGDYIFCDYMTGHFWTTSVNDTTAAFNTYQQSDVSASTSTFGEGSDGELYIASRSAGIIYHLTAGCPEIAIAVSISEEGDSLVADRIYGQFQWYRNGVIIAGANQFYITPDSDGTYTLQAIVNIRGCHYTALSNAIVIGDCNFPACRVSIELINDTIFSSCGGDGLYTWTVYNDIIYVFDEHGDFLVPNNEGGSYQLTIIDTLDGPDCIRYDTSNFVTVVGDAVRDISVEIVQMYPNPASNEVHMSVKGNISELFIVDVEGKSHSADYTTNFQEVIVPVNELPKGCYFIRVVADDKIYSGSFMKE